MSSIRPVRFLRAVALAAAVFLPAVAAAASSLAAASAAERVPEAETVEGVWINVAGDGYIEVRRQGDTLHGTILGGPDGDERLDEKNPDPKLRDRRLTGLRILEGFEPDGPGKWKGGQIYDPNNGKTYGCTLELEDPNTLKVRGYIGVSLFGRTERWKRKE